MVRKSSAAAERIRASAAEARNAIEGLRGSIEGYRAKIADLKDQREATLRAPATMEEALAQLDARLGSAALTYNFESLYSTLCDPDVPVMEGRGMRHLELISTYSVSSSDINELLTAMLGAEIRKFLETGLQRRFDALAKDGILPLSKAQRAERLAMIDAELFEAESDEEALIVEAERAGFAIERRSDLDPRVYLEVAE